MNKILLRLSMAAILFASIIVACLFIKSDDQSLHYSILDKRNRLSEAEGGKIIFVGGSNLSFGLDSELIHQSLHRNIVNMGVQASIGLKYQLELVGQHVKNGDWIVIVPEYNNFWDYDVFLGQYPMVKIIFDIFPKDLRLLEFRQIVQMLNYLPEYCSKKIKGLFRRTAEESVYSRKAFNQYGDAVRHWGMTSLSFDSIAPHGDEKIHSGVIRYLNKFRERMQAKGAMVLFMYPCFQDRSFRKYERIIKRLHRELSEDLTIPVLSPPDNYRLNDTLFFNGPYHPNREGVLIRSSRVIQDLNKFIVTRGS